MTRRIVWIGAALLLAGCSPGGRDFSSSSGGGGQAGQGGEGGSGGAQAGQGGKGGSGGAERCTLGVSKVGACALQ